MFGGGFLISVLFDWHHFNVCLFDYKNSNNFYYFYFTKISWNNTGLRFTKRECLAV